MNTYQSCANGVQVLYPATEQTIWAMRATTRLSGAGWPDRWSPGYEGAHDRAGWANEDDSLDVLRTVAARNSDEFYRALKPSDVIQPCDECNIANYFA
jgi:hypothetical protein